MLTRTYREGQQSCKDGEGPAIPWNYRYTLIRRWLWRTGNLNVWRQLPYNRGACPYRPAAVRWLYFEGFI